MVPLIVIGAILATLALLLAAPLEASLYYDGDFTLKAGVSFLKLRIFPDYETDLASDKLTVKQKRRLLQKMQRKERRAAKKEEKKKRAKKQTAAPKSAPKKPVRKKKLGKGKGILRDMRYVTRLIRMLAIRLGGKLTVRIDYLDVSLATGDAANTAYLYGAVSQSLSYLLTAAATYAKLRVKEKDVTLHADFLGEETTVKGKITLKIRVWSVLSLLLSALMMTLKEKTQQSQQKP